MKGPQKLQPAKTLSLKMESLVSPPAASADGLFIGDEREVAKLDRHSLELQWRVPVAGGQVPIGTIGSIVVLGSYGKIYGMSADSGQSLWGPLPLGYCLVWKDQLIGLRPLDVIDPSSGKVVARLADDDLSGDASCCGHLVVGTSTTSSNGDPICAYDLDSREMRWRRSLFDESVIRVRSNSSTRVMCANESWVLLSRADRIFGCAMTDGSIQWDFTTAIRHFFPSVVGSNVYLLAQHASNESRLVCLDIATGAIRYDAAQPVRATDSARRGIVHGDQIVFATNKGALFGFAQADGRLIWRAQIRDEPTYGISVDQRILIPTLDGNLFVFEPPTS